MANTESTVGIGGEYTDISTWESDIESSGAGEHTALLISDITDATIFLGWAEETSLVVKSDKPGTKRTITSYDGIFSTILYLNDDDITRVTCEDIILAGDADTPSAGWGMSLNYKQTITCNRVGFKNLAYTGFTLSANTQSGATANFDNCIFDSCGYFAFMNLATTNPNVTTFRNCLFTNLTYSQASISNSSNITINYYNCLSFDNTGEDFTNAALTTTNLSLNSCVSEDDTATDTAHDNWAEPVNCVSEQTDLTTYFKDQPNGNYALAQSDFDSWGIVGSDANTPDTDYNNLGRIENSIGPFEWTLPPFTEITNVFVSFGGRIPHSATGEGVGQFTAFDDTIQPMSTYDNKFIDDKRY